MQSAIAEAGYDSLPGFAQEMGWSRSCIYQYANGTNLVQLDRLKEIAERTGKPLEWFLVDDINGAVVQSRVLGEQLAQAESRIQELEGALAQERGARLSQGQRDREALLEAARELCLGRRREGEGERMLEAAARYMELARAAADQRAIMDAQLQTGHASFLTGNFGRAREALGEALEMALRLRDEAAEHSARQELVRALQASGRAAEAREHARQVAAAKRWWPRWSGQVALAALAEQLGELEEAEACLEAAEEVVEAPEAPSEHRPAARAYLESNRCNLALARGWYSKALERSERLYDLAAQAGLTDQVREAALNRGLANLRLGHMMEAAEQLSRLQEWAAMSGDQRIGALAQVFESERLARSGHAMAAKETALAAMDAATAAGIGLIVGEAELALAMACLQQRQQEEAEYHLERCQARAQRLELRRLEVAARLGLARVRALEPGAYEEAAQLASLTAQIGYQDLESEALSLQARRGMHKQAAKLAASARSTARAAGYFWGEWEAVLTEAEVQLYHEKLGEAEKLLAEAVHLKQTRVPPPEGPWLFAEESALRETLVHTCRRMGQDARAERLEQMPIAPEPPWRPSTDDGEQKA